MDTALTIITDIIIIATFPLHCRYLYVMLQNNPQLASLDYAFRAALTNIVIANLLYSIVFLLVREPAAYGLFSDFYKSQSWWLGKLFMIQAVPLTVITGIFHVFIALNRFSALCFPMGHTRLWSEIRVKRVLIGIWAVTLIECIPLIYPIEGESYIIEVFGSMGIAFRLEGDLPNLSLAMGVGGLMEIFVVIIYSFIGCRVSRLKNLPHSTTSVTVCALLVSTGGFAIILVVLPYMLAYRLAGINLWSPEMFNALFKFAFAYNNAIAPWVMVLYYRNIRHLLLGKQGDAQVSPTITILEQKKTTTF